MQNFDDLMAQLLPAEKKAIEALAGCGWMPLTDAEITNATTQNSRFPTYTIGGRYAVCITLKSMQDRPAAAIETKKRGRPKKL